MVFIVHLNLLSYKEQRTCGRAAVTSLRRDLGVGKSDLGKTSWQFHAAIRIAYESLGAGGRCHNWDGIKEKAGIQDQTANVKRFSGRGLREQVAKTFSYL